MQGEEMPVNVYPADSEAASHAAPANQIDVLTICSDARMADYWFRLFRSCGWKIAQTRTCADSVSFVKRNRVAVAVCDATLPDGSWRDAALAFRSVAAPPALVVVGRDGALTKEVAAIGGFDTLIGPRQDSEMIWTVADAWQSWMKRNQAANGDGR
jgi:hypothetical protein